MSQTALTGECRGNALAKIALPSSQLACQSLAGSRESHFVLCNGQASLIPHSADLQYLNAPKSYPASEIQRHTRHLTSMKAGSRCGISMPLLLPLSKPAIEPAARVPVTILGEKQDAT